MKVLALDLGMERTGWALAVPRGTPHPEVRTSGVKMESGVFVPWMGKGKPSHGQLFEEVLALLYTEFNGEEQPLPELVVVEVSPMAPKGTAAIERAVVLRTAVEVWAIQNQCRYEEVHASVIRAHAGLTGLKRVEVKLGLRLAARRLWDLDDAPELDEADALVLLDLVVQRERKSPAARQWRPRR